MALAKVHLPRMVSLRDAAGRLSGDRLPRQSKAPDARLGGLFEAAGHSSLDRWRYSTADSFAFLQTPTSTADGGDVPLGLIAICPVHSLLVLRKTGRPVPIDAGIFVFLR